MRTAAFPAGACRFRSRVGGRPSAVAAAGAGCDASPPAAAANPRLARRLAQQCPFDAVERALRQHVDAVYDVVEQALAAKAVSGLVFYFEISLFSLISP